ncbi:hypothetical protein CJ030_MR3G017065 [Morella rubra]|uniref:Cold-regulated protein 27 n=1 Tax=Morella rubra TaxID=262757 RepID=A0A6A1W4W2_9ROSI|nr:hypothetical protein CJ030_MR3G017065 [Morella rubra]
MGDFRARAARRSPPASINDGSCESKEPSSLGNLVTESKSTEWTDEKHSLYLKSMEASFVNKLYDSSELLGFCRLSDPTNSRKKHFTARSRSGQFKVLRGGSWQKIHFERAPDLQLMKEEGSRGLLTNPWIRHFRHACTPQVGASVDVHNNAACASEALDLIGNHSISCGSEACNLEQIDACHHDLVGSDTGKLS